VSTFSQADAVSAPPPADETVHSTARNKKRRTRRRIAKALAWASLVVTALFVLADPWLLIPVITFAVALSLWD